MAWQVTVPVLILLATAAIVACTAWLVWRRRETPGGYELFWLLGAILIWSLTAAMEATASPLPAKIFWSKVEYIGATSTTPFLLIFCLTFTHRKHWLTKTNMAVLWTMPVIIFLLAATNEWHHLIWTSFEPSPNPADNLYIYHHGLAYWVYVSYTYIYAFTAALLILQEYIHTSHIYKSQNGTILFSMLFPWIGSSMYVFELNPIPGLDTTPISFAFTALVIAWGLFSTRLLDLIPIAHDVLIHNMQDGVVVIDPGNRVIEANPATATLLNCAEIPTGRNVYETFSKWPTLASILTQKPDLPNEIILTGDETRYLDVRVTSIINPQGRKDGYLAVLREITGLKQVEFALEEKSFEMERQAITDELTDLYNRRYLEKSLEVEFKKSERYNTELSLALIDVDDFKNINDTFGHRTGDDALRFVADTLKSSLRRADIAVRMGGDEFLAIMPLTDLESAWSVIERIRIIIQNESFPTSTSHISISAGVTGWVKGDTPENALKRVDSYLYRAKQSGKNRVIQGK